MEVENTLSGFKLATPFFCFNDVKEYMQIFPTYYPYGVGGGIMDSGINGIKLNLLRIMFFILGKNSRFSTGNIGHLY